MSNAMCEPISAVVETDSSQSFAEELARTGAGLPSRIEATPDNASDGLAKLVLTLVELIRQLLERQAIRRMDAGSLSDEEIERVGETLMALETKMTELKEVFGLSSEDLNLDLGPLGNLL